MKAALFTTLVLSTIACGCSNIPSPATQATAIENAVDCVKDNWGQPVETIATACLASSVPAALDIIADVEALVQSGVLPDAYKNDDRVKALLAKKLATKK